VTTVLVVARRAAVRARLERLIAGSRRLRLLSGSPAAPLAVQIGELHPDVLLVNLDADRLGSALARVRSGPGGPVVVVLAAAPRRLLGAHAMQLGVRAVLPADATAEEVVAAVEAAAAGLVALHPEALDALRPPAPSVARAETSPDARSLTAREIEVLGMMAEGLGNKIIASRLGISPHTAKFHVGAIMAKLGAGSRTEAVTIGVRLGLVAI
jgi:two-component system, NarL family, response regulator YdfI